MSSGSAVQLPPTTLPLNTMTPYLRAHLDVTDDTLHWESWHVALGFVPIRRNRLSLPLSEASEARCGVGMHWDRLLVGVALVVWAMAWAQWWAAAAALGAAAVLFAMTPTAQLSVTTKDDRTRRLSLCILHRLDVALVTMALADLTGRRPRRTPPQRREPTPPGTGAITS